MNEARQSGASIQRGAVANPAPWRFRVKKLGSALVGMLVLTLAACSSGSAAADAPTAAASSSVSAASAQWGMLNTSYSDALAVPVQLAVGTMQLDGTENAVTAEQAGELLTLWQGYSSLLSGEYAAQEEYDGLQHQIEETMSAAQLAIDRQARADRGRPGIDHGQDGAGLGGAARKKKPALLEHGSSARAAVAQRPAEGRRAADVAEAPSHDGRPARGMESTATARRGAAASAPVSLQATGDINPGLSRRSSTTCRASSIPPPATEVPRFRGRREQALGIVTASGSRLRP